MEKKRYKISVADTGQAFTCGEDEFVFNAMLRARCGPIHYGCCGGGCGACKMKISSGEYVAEKRMSRAHVTEQEERSGIVLICCVKPRGELEIERVNGDTGFSD